VIWLVLICRPSVIGKTFKSRFCWTKQQWNAAGNFNNLSDIDIALVSDAFKGDRISDKDKIRSVTLSVSSAIEVMPFSPADFDPRNPFVKEILKTGIHLI
jgi:uncharacterized protein